MSLDLPNGKTKAVLMPWIEFSLLLRFIQIHARANRLDEIRRSAERAKGQPTLPGSRELGVAS
jgi:hypothetical protein